MTMKTKNVNEAKGKKKHTGLMITLVVLFVVVLECCFSTNTYDNPEPVSVDSVEESTETEKKETKASMTKVETEVKETETEDDLDSEVSAEILAEQGIYITPFDTYVSYQGGSNQDEVLYINVLYEDDETMKYVGFADNNGKPDTSLSVDILMHKVEDGADNSVECWVSDDNKWVANYDASGSFYFGEQSSFDSDFMGTFQLLEDESFASASTDEEVLTFESSKEFKDFARDTSNIGKVVNFDADIFSANCADGTMHIDILWADGSITEDAKVLKQDNNSSTIILDGDYANISAEYLGIDDLGYITFSPVSIELLDLN